MNVKKIILGVILFLVLTFNVSAMSLKPTGTTKVKKGGDLEVYITLERNENEGEIRALEGKLSYDETILTLKDQELLMDDWMQLSSVKNNQIFSYADLASENIITGVKTNVTKLIFTVNSNPSTNKTKIEISTPNAIDINKKEVEVSGGTLEINIVSDVNTLSSIKIDGTTIDNFKPDTLTYSKNVGDKESIIIGAEKTDSKSTITGDIGTKTLKYGVNTFKIIVTSESGIKKEYVLNITREDTRSKVNTLKTLKLDNGTINFKPETTSYNVNVGGNVEKVKITSELTDSKSKYVSGYGNREVALKIGKNSILVKVQAENGDIRTYTINVIKEDPRSNVNTLKSLEIDKAKINFKSTVLTYNIKVEESVEKVKITSELTDSKSKYVNGYGNREVTLKQGLNQILVKVQAENETIKTYTLNITRGQSEEDKAKNANIKELTIENSQIDFKSDVFEYEVNIEDETSLDINLNLENSEATYEIIGNENLEDGSVVTIKVTSSDKSIVNEYKLNIKVKEKEEDNIQDDDNQDLEDNNNKNFFDLYIGIGVLVIGVLLFIIALIVKNKKKKVIE